MYYEKVLTITEEYLGPAAGRFLDRQILSHLKKDPQQLTREDISMLAVRIRSGLAVLTKDEQTVNEAFKRISGVADS